MTALIGSPAATKAVSAIVADHGHLHVPGNHVVAASGRPGTLRGMSLFWGQWKPVFYNAEAVRWIASDWHATTVCAAIVGANGG